MDKAVAEPLLRQEGSTIVIAASKSWTVKLAAAFFGVAGLFTALSNDRAWSSSQLHAPYTTELASAPAPDYHAAVRHLKELFPEQSSTISAHESRAIRDIERHSPRSIVIKVNSAHDVHSGQLVPPIRPLVQNYKDCEAKSINVIVEGTLFLVGLFGIVVPSNDGSLASSFSQWYSEEVSGVTKLSFQSEIGDFAAAHGAWAKAETFTVIMKSVWNASGFTVLMAWLKNNMTAWDWVKACTILLANLLLLFGTHGVAVVAIIALQIMSAIQLGEDSRACVVACST